MSITKRTKDYFYKVMSGGKGADREIAELHQYFRLYGPISFDFVSEKDFTVAKSVNFRQGSIITFGKSPEEMDKKIKDAILTVFGVPSVYADRAKVVSVREKENSKQKEYACN